MDFEGTLNELPKQYVREIKYQQPLLGNGGGAQGINGFLMNYQFSGAPAGPTMLQLSNAAGASVFEQLSDMALAPSSIREPSWIPVGLNNAAYAEIYEGAL